MTREKLNSTISSWLPLYNQMISMTIVSAITAPLVGILDHQIKTLGRWSTEIYLLYNGNCIYFQEPSMLMLIKSIDRSKP